MSHQLGIPKAALNSLIQMVDHDAQVKPGMEVVILAHTDGLYGSDNLVDEQAVSAMAASSARVATTSRDRRGVSQVKAVCTGTIVPVAAERGQTRTAPRSVPVPRRMRVLTR